MKEQLKQLATKFLGYIRSVMMVGCAKLKMHIIAATKKIKRYS